MGGKGWMVYDRERRGPAMIGMDLAENLTRERAEELRHMLVASGRGPTAGSSWSPGYPMMWAVAFRLRRGRMIQDAVSRPTWLPTFCATKTSTKIRWRLVRYCFI